MERLNKSTFSKRLKGVIGIVIFIGVVLKLMDKPYGGLVFTIGFLAYFILKIIDLLRIGKIAWTKLHSIQLILTVLSIVALLLMYYGFPYSRVAFISLIFAESLVNLKIIINTYIGNDNFKTILSFIGKLLRR